MVPLAYVFAILSTVYMLVLWINLFRRYRARIYQMRQGVYFYNRCRFTEQVGSNYIGYQCAFMLANSVWFCFVALGLLFFAAIAVVGILAWSQTSDSSTSLPVPSPPSPPPPLSGQDDQGVSPPQTYNLPWIPHVPAAVPTQITAYSINLSRVTSAGRSLPPLLFWLILPLLGQFLLNRFMFFTTPTRFRDGRRGNSWLRYRFLYGIYEYLLILPNMGIGFLFITIRIILAPFLASYYLFAMDACVAPGATATEAWDPAFCSYVSVAASDHRYNNPIIMVFLGIMQESLSSHRLESGQMKVKRELYRRLLATALSKSEPRVGCGIGCFGIKSKQAVQLPEPSAATGDLLSEPADVVRERWRKRRRVLNRWQLARMLLMNPSLVHFREHNLGTYGIHELDGELALGGELSKLGQLGKRWGHGLSNGLSNSLSRTRESISSATGPLRDRVSSATSPVRERISSATSPLRQRMSSATSPLRERMPSFKDMGDKISAPVQGVGDAFSSMGDKSKQAVKGVGDAFSSMGDKSKQAVKGVGDAWEAVKR